jgi:hypothetical protein
MPFYRIVHHVRMETGYIYLRYLYEIKIDIDIHMIYDLQMFMFTIDEAYN